MKYTFKKGGIHPPENKLTADSPIQHGPKADKLTVMLQQNIGAPSKPIVKKGDHLRKGQPIAEPGGFVGAWVHSPCEADVLKIDTVLTPQGYPAQAIMLERKETGEEEFRFPPIDFMNATPQELVSRIAEAGIVGLGGAAFPTAVKLMPPKGMTPECVIINGAECEPYLTCDDRLMREYPQQICKGAYCLMRAAGVRSCYIGIEENKSEAIAAMQQAAAEFAGMKVCVLRTKYPQGGEKQLIQAIMSREVASGALPVSVGAIVDNVATAYAVYQAVAEGKPLTERVLTLTGQGMLNAGNYLVEIGTPLSALAQLDDKVNKLIGGGPMMGKAISNADAPTVKGFSGLLAMELGEAAEIEPCIRCGACYDVCPMGLQPMLLARCAEYSDPEYALEEGVLDCIECGSCVYVCPASRRLLDWIRLGKTEARKLKK